MVSGHRLLRLVFFSLWMRRSWGRQRQGIKREAIIPLSLRRFVEILNTVMLRTVTRQLQKESVMLRLGPVVLTERGVVSFGASCVGEREGRVLFVVRERPEAWRLPISRDIPVALLWANLKQGKPVAAAPHITRRG